MSERGFWLSIKFLAIYASIFVHLIGRFVSAHEGINVWFEMMLGDSCVYWTRANIFWSMTHIFNKISLSNSSSWRTREIPQALHPSLHVPSFWFRHSIRNCFLYPRSKISQYMRERSENVQSKDAFLHCYYQTLRFLRLVVASSSLSRWEIWQLSFLPKSKWKKVPFERSSSLQGSVERGKRKINFRFYTSYACSTQQNYLLCGNMGSYTNLLPRTHIKGELRRQNRARSQNKENEVEEKIRAWRP